MKKLGKIIVNILYAFTIIWDILEFLVLPILFAVIGIFGDFPWQYYVITIGGYFLLWGLIELILHFVFKAMEKRYTPKIEKFLDKVADLFSKAK